LEKTHVPSAACEAEPALVVALNEPPESPRPNTESYLGVNEASPEDVDFDAQA
jgi:hypothetical protein